MAKEIIFKHILLYSDSGNILTFKVGSYFYDYVVSIGDAFEALRLIREETVENAYIFLEKNYKAKRKIK